MVARRAGISGCLKRLDCFTILEAIFLLGVTSILSSSCARPSSEKSITIAGSTSIQPLADRWAEVYMKKHPGLGINVQGGGSSAGIQAAKSGAADIGMSSRELKPEEKDLLEVIVAWDGLAIIVHPTNPVDDLSIVQVQNIFAGNIRRWAFIGGPDKDIHVVTREEGSGTRDAFQEMVMGRMRIFKGAIVQDSNGTVREIVANDPYSIGYISLGLVNERVKAIRLDGVEASVENIENRKYRLVRPFLFLTSGPPGSGVRDFLNFVLSREGQELIRKEGLIPVFKE